MSGASEHIAKLLAQQANLNADTEKLTERIITHETQLVSFGKSVKTMAEPLYDHAEFEKARQDMEKALQDHKSPNVNPSMASALSLLETLDVAAVSEVVQDREKHRQERYAAANRFMVAIQKSLDVDRARLAKSRAELEEVNKDLKAVKK